MACQAHQQQDIPNLFIAAASAYNEFETVISSKRSEGELGAFFADIRNYEIVLTIDGSICAAEFRPRPFNGNLVRGGGARYVIELRTGKILSTERYR
jgi:hypothetical protein